MPLDLARGVQVMKTGLLGAAASLWIASAAHAHEGHGMPGTSHWHATDIWGFAVAGGVVALLIWMKGRK
jgi:hypothetical protein